jgi:hypothetical protein
MGETKSLLDLHERRLCRIEQPSAIKLSMEGDRLIMAYAPWS